MSDDLLLDDAEANLAPPDSARNLIDEDIPCHRCGYNLRSLREDAQCPECGFDVEESLRLNETVGNPRWVRAAHRGVTTGLIAIGLALGGWLALMVGVNVLMPLPRMVVSVVIVAMPAMAILCLVLGWMAVAWVTTAKGAAPDIVDWRSRQAAVPVYLAATFLIAMYVLLNIFGDWHLIDQASPLLLTAIAAAFSLDAFILCRFGQYIARRLLATTLGNQCEIVAWGYFSVGLCLPLLVIWSWMKTHHHEIDAWEIALTASCGIVAALCFFWSVGILVQWRVLLGCIVKRFDIAADSRA